MSYDNENVAATFLHEDGTASRIIWDQEPMNPRSDFEHLSLMVNTNTDFYGPDRGYGRDTETSMHGVMRSAIAHFGGNNSDEQIKVARYLTIYYGALAVEWRSVVGNMQREWDSILGAVFPSKELTEALGGEVTPEQAAEILKAEHNEYSAYFAGEVYGLLTAPEDVVATSIKGNDEDGFETDWNRVFGSDGVESCWGFIGYPSLRELAESQVGSPVKTQID